MASKTPRNEDRIPVVSIDLEIPRGGVQKYASINKFGKNAAVASGGTEEIWDGSIAYTFETTAAITHIRAKTDSATTQGLNIEVQGLDANWDLVVQEKALDATNSTTEVALDTPLIRIFRMKVVDSAVADVDIWAGDDDFAESAARAVIIAGNNQTLMAIYTVPRAKSAYVTNYYATVNPGGGAPTTLDIKLWAADNANSYAKQLKHVMGVSGDVDAYGRFQHFFKPFYKITEKTDIYITGTTAGAAASVSAGFDLILIDD